MDNMLFPPLITQKLIEQYEQELSGIISFFSRCKYNKRVFKYHKIFYFKYVYVIIVYRYQL